MSSKALQAVTRAQVDTASKAHHETFELVA